MCTHSPKSIELVAAAQRTTNKSVKRAFLLTWPAVMQIYWNQRNFFTTKEFNSRRIGLGHQHSRHLIVLLHQQGLYHPKTRWQRKRHFKSELTFFQSLLRLFLSIYFIKSRRILLQMNSQDSYPSSEKETAKKCTKRRDARAKLLFCLLNGPVHVNAFTFENAYNSMPLDLPSTLIRWAFSSKTHRFVNA